jgi:hypothetical protein
MQNDDTNSGYGQPPGQPVYPPVQQPNQNPGMPPQGYYQQPPPQQYIPQQQQTVYPGSIPQVPPAQRVAGPASVPGIDKKIPDRKSVATKFIELVYLLLIILESVLLLRFIFKLLGANPDNTFIRFLYEATKVFTFPFEGLFGYYPQNSIAVSRYQLEFTTLVAMGVYALIAFLIVKIIDIFR